VARGAGRPRFAPGGGTPRGRAAPPDATERRFGGFSPVLERGAQIRFWPLTCLAILWHNVPRRPPGVRSGAFHPRFSFPQAADFPISRKQAILRLGGHGLVLVFLRP